MALQLKFRGAFNGFNREDVVNYISRVNHEHETRVNGLENEKGILEQALAQEKKKVAALEAELETLRQQAEEKRVLEELEIFRRAEQAEREAGERVSHAYAKADGVLAEALARAEALAEELAQLRQTLETGRGCLVEEEKT